MNRVSLLFLPDVKSMIENIARNVTELDKLNPLVKRLGGLFVCTPVMSIEVYGTLTV